MATSKTQLFLVNGGNWLILLFTATFSFSVSLKHTFTFSLNTSLSSFFSFFDYWLAAGYIHLSTLSSRRISLDLPQTVWTKTNGEGEDKD
ncbi:hypothetical protein L1887_23882 [Cichorium endivia]|nr:hypothetical protein L1887_23882 [Cichorium endivia]